MRKQLLGELLIIGTGTLFFFALSATVGISGDEKRAPATVAAEGVELSMGEASVSGPDDSLGGGWEQ